MVRLEVNNLKFKVTGNQREVFELHKALKVRNPNAFHLRKFMPRGWDGKIDFMSSSGYVQSGLLPRVMDLCKEMEIEYTILDLRDIHLLKPKARYKLPGGQKLRDYQKYILDSIVYNVLEPPKGPKIYWPRGVSKPATNAGKTIMSAATHHSFQANTLYIINSTELLWQAIEEIEEFLPGQVGWIHSKGISWNNFMVCMVKTLLNRLPEIKEELSQYKVVIIDECDLADNKTYKTVMNSLPGCLVRVGMSGTIFMSELKKDLPKNMSLEGMFGNLLSEITNRELADKGYSSEVHIRILRGNPYPDLGVDSFGDEYLRGVIKNKKRNLKVISRIGFHGKRKRKFGLIIAKNHLHIKILYKLAIKKYPDLVIEWVHHKRDDRHKVVKRFKEGKVDVLIGSLILKRGKNFPLMQWMVNAAGGLNPETPIQLLGRATRKHDSKTRTYYEDFWDEGRYLKRHSRRRVAYYKKENFKVQNPYK